MNESEPRAAAEKTIYSARKQWSVDRARQRHTRVQLSRALVCKTHAGTDIAPSLLQKFYCAQRPHRRKYYRTAALSLAHTFTWRKLYT